MSAELSPAERLLDQALAASRQWAVDVDDLIGSPQLTDEDGDRGSGLLMQIRTIVVPEFHACLTLLSHPVESWTVDVILRSMLEAVAHAAWVAEGERPGTRPDSRRCLGTDAEDVFIARRASCLEFGMAKANKSNLDQANPGSMQPEALANARTWLEEVTQRHQATGCVGRGRSYRDVAPMLLYWQSHYKLGWPADLWRMTSGVGHHMTPFRATTIADGQVTWGGPMPLKERAFQLHRVHTVFANLMQYVVLAITPTQVEAFREMTKPSRGLVTLAVEQTVADVPSA